MLIYIKLIFFPDYTRNIKRNMKKIIDINEGSTINTINSLS